MRSIGVLYTKVEEKINEFNSIKDAITICENEIRDIDEVISNPALLNEKPSLKIYLSGERHNNLSDINYLRIISLSEDFNPELLEIEQIKETYNILKDLLEKRKEFYSEKYEKYKEIIDKDSLTISILNDFKNLISRYSQYTYIDVEEMDIIKRAFDVLTSTINDDEEILDLFKQFYFEIANNNSRLETQIREEILERNVREREQEDLDRINKSKQSLISETETIEERTIREEYFAKLRNTDYYQNIERIKDSISENLYKKLVILGNEYKKSLELLTNTIVDDIITIEKLFDQNIDMYELLDSYDRILSDRHISLVIVKKINELIKENNLDKLEDSINDTKVSLMNVLSNEDFLEYNDYTGYLELFNNIKESINQYDLNINMIQSIELSASSLSKQEKLKYLEENNISKDEYYQYLLIKGLKELKLDIAEYGNIDSSEIEEKYTGLSSLYDEYKDFRTQEGDPIETKKTLKEKLDEFNKNPYSGSFENYVVFLVPEDLKATIKKYVELEEEETANKIYFIIKSNLATLLKGGKKKESSNANSRPIMIDENVPNSYKIRELKAGGRESRLGFKVMQSKFNDKNVIMVITTARGKINKNDKNAELQRNISLYEEREDYYKKIEEMFGLYSKIETLDEKEQEKVREFVEDLIVDGIKVYNDLIDSNGGAPSNAIQATNSNNMGGNVL